VEIYKSIIPKIVEKNQEATLLIVSNPVDIMTYVALKLSGYPRNKVIGSGTVLDTARLKYLLSRHLDVDSRSIHAFIIGEHGDSELAVWSAANVSGIPLNHFCELRGYFDHMESMDRIYQSVRDSAYEIIEKKGATYYGVAMAVCRIAESVIRNEHSIMPISVYLDGLYGLHDICLSIPTVVGQEGAEKVLDIPLDLMEMGKLVYSAEELKKIIGELEL
jgi:L-lactate dehydrogenase